MNAPIQPASGNSSNNSQGNNPSTESNPTLATDPAATPPSNVEPSTEALKEEDAKKGEEPKEKKKNPIKFEPYVSPPNPLRGLKYMLEQRLKNEGVTYKKRDSEKMILIYQECGKRWREMTPEEREKQNKIADEHENDEPKEKEPMPDLEIPSYTFQVDPSKPPFYGYQRQ
ncbi:hypothetical protein TRFO_27322 [Tritrichomonas foetus]|uniref:Uncharacterized protein n=1 Tax=Tritrichomonas foetus TaxID=1144522 RepID=A0A1J4K0W3_9EUKA|nr:hypothetical protein TRFO_27322 [Tritrichomonas foetus]|eukprot:OHT05015.1 hypothetical protein TRFO_27322 [Tritrichomonas foetus]